MDDRERKDRIQERKRVLVCEDEDNIRDFVAINLRRAGYEVVDVNSGEAALQTFEQENGNFEIILLDIMLPGIDGFTVCKTIKSQTDFVGIIILSAKGQEMDKVNGLYLGADDYITKPFALSELTARVDALCRRVSLMRKEKDVIMHSGPFMLNLGSRSLYKNGERIELTPVEYQIIEYFLSNRNTALDRASILAHIWGDGYYGDNKIVDVNIRRLRMKLEDDPSNPRYILTIWGYGYKWDDRPQPQK